MSQHHILIRQVYDAKADMALADALISNYMPFIRSETSKFLNGKPAHDSEDALSIAMIAFHEAIQGYSKLRGAFLHYAAMTIRSRLIDFYRKEQRHRNLISLDTPANEEEEPLHTHLADERQETEERIHRETTHTEIAELSEQLASFGVSLTDVADNCPKQQRTMEACQKAIAYAKANPALIQELVDTGRLPIARLAAGTNVERKTLERHRKYLVALLLVYSNGYEIIRGHLSQLGKGGAVL